MNDWNPIARVGYGAYAHSTGGKTFDGRDMPAWDSLPPRIQVAWEAAVAAAFEAALEAAIEANKTG